MIETGGSMVVKCNQLTNWTTNASLSSREQASKCKSASAQNEVIAAAQHQNIPSSLHLCQYNQITCTLGAVLIVISLIVIFKGRGGGRSLEMKMGGSEQLSADIKVASSLLLLLLLLQSAPNEAIPKMASLPFRI